MNLLVINNLILLTTIFMSGGAVLIIEIIGTKILAPVFGSTIFVWSSLITTTLGGLAAGYYLGGIMARHHGANDFLRGLRAIFYKTIIFSGLFLIILPNLSQIILTKFSNMDLKTGPLITSLLLFGPLFVVFGALTPLALQIKEQNIDAFAAGKIYAISTLGSLTGSLLAGFFLIPLLSITTIFKIVGTVLILLAITGLVINNKFNKTTASIILSMIFLAYASTYSVEKSVNLYSNLIEVIEEKNTFYSSFRVISYSDIICLMAGLAAHSCVHKTTKNPPKEIYFIEKGLKPMLEKLVSGQKILLLGGGSQTMLKNTPNGVKTTIVEIDPETIKLGEKYLGLNKGSNKSEIIIDDARHAAGILKERGDSYDLIIIDVFQDFSLPPHIFSIEAMRLFKEILNPEGLIVVNGGVFMKKPDEDNFLVNSIINTSRMVFKNVGAFFTNDTNEAGNVIFYFSPKTLPQVNLWKIDTQYIDAGRQYISDNYNALEYYGLENNLKVIQYSKDMLYR